MARAEEFGREGVAREGFLEEASQTGSCSICREENQ